MPQSSRQRFPKTVRRTMGVTGLALLVPSLALLVAGPAAHADPPMCHGKAATIVGASTAHTIVGTEADDVIVAGSATRTVKGLGGDDTICAGGAAGVEIDGGPGNDLLDSDSDQPGADKLVGGPGNDRLIAGGDGTGTPNVSGPDRCVITRASATS
jgi:Ca2+-binding RTX toxin-like protein